MAGSQNPSDEDGVLDQVIDKAWSCKFSIFASAVGFVSWFSGVYALVICFAVMMGIVVDVRTASNDDAMGIVGDAELRNDQKED